MVLLPVFLAVVCLTGSWLTLRHSDAPAFVATHQSQLMRHDSIHRDGGVDWPASKSLPARDALIALVT